MKNLKLLGIAAVAAMALMAFAASSASATALYNGATKLGVGSEIDFSLSSGTKIVMSETGGEVLNECTGSTMKGSISNAGGAAATPKISLGSLTFTICTFPTITVTLSGGPEIHQIGTGTNGTVTATGQISVTINTLFFGTCVYSLSGGVDLGTTTTGSVGRAKFHWNLTALRGSGSNIVCPETIRWTATYDSTTPENLRVEAS